MSWPPLLVVTDLDGTLLDHHDYSWRAAAPAIERLRAWGAALILNSSKTRPEMLALRRELGNRDPFVVENGSAIVRPRAGKPERYLIEPLGPPRSEMLSVLHAIRERERFRFVGFADFSLEQIREHTGLDADAARHAAERDGTEPLLWQDPDRSPDELAAALEPHGLRLVSGGRFLHVMGAMADKGRATRVLVDQYRVMRPGLRTIGLGDSANDLDMLRAVDHPVVIPRVDGSVLDPGPLPNLLRAPSPGPEGWRWAIDHWLDTLSTEA